MSNNCGQSLKRAHISNNGDINLLQVHMLVSKQGLQVKGGTNQKDLAAELHQLHKSIGMTRLPEVCNCCVSGVYLDTEGGCISGVTDITGCDDVYASSKACTCTGRMRRYSQQQHPKQGDTTQRIRTNFDAICVSEKLKGSFVHGYFTTRCNLLPYLEQLQ